MKNNEVCGKLSTISGSQEDIMAGYYIINNGRIAASSSYGNGDVVCVSSGGRVWSSTVNNDGTMYIFSGGVADNTTINYGCYDIDGGWLYGIRIQNYLGVFSEK